MSWKRTTFWAGSLQASSTTMPVKDTWVFKGGTCLKKCYFETYRFSEDLDFTLSDESHLGIDFPVPTFREIGAWVYEQTGIELPPDKVHFEVFQNRRGRPAGQGR